MALNIRMDDPRSRVDGPSICLPFVSWAAAIAAACLLSISAIMHLGNPYQFLSAICAYQLVPIYGAEVLALLLPFLHITLATALVSGLATRAAFRFASILFSLYAIGQFITWMRGIKVNCGCFGPAEEVIDGKSMGIAVAASLICALGYWASRPTCLVRDSSHHVQATSAA